MMETILAVWLLIISVCCMKITLRLDDIKCKLDETEKTGRWIAERYCSECEWDKYEAELVCDIPTNYCPNCGAKMKGGE